jgi:hypothetical protein
MYILGINAYDGDAAAAKEIRGRRSDVRGQSVQVIEEDAGRMPALPTFFVRRRTMVVRSTRPRR